jgi:hypothetical protein
MTYVERLTLTLPADPALSRLIRLVVLHFLRHNGVGAAAARRGARTVEGKCAPWLRALASRRGRNTLSIALAAGARILAVDGESKAPRARRRLLRAARRPSP